MYRVSIIASRTGKADEFIRYRGDFYKPHDRTRIDGYLNLSVTHSFAVKPLWVRIQGEIRPFSAGKTYEIGCEVVGARPEPKITWSKGNLILRNARQTVRLKIDRRRFNALINHTTRVRPGDFPGHSSRCVIFLSTF